MLIKQNSGATMNQVIDTDLAAVNSEYKNLTLIKHEYNLKLFLHTNKGIKSILTIISIPGDYPDTPPTIKIDAKLGHPKLSREGYFLDPIIENYKTEKPTLLKIISTMIKEFEVNHLIHREEGRHSVNSIINEEERKEGFGDFYSQILELKDEVSRAKTSQKILKKQIDKLKCELKEQFDSLSQLLVIKLQGDNQTQLINFLVPPFLYIDTEEFKHGNSYVKFYKDKITDTRVALKLVQLHMKEELKEELEMVLAEFKNMLKCSNSISCVVTPYQFAYNDDCVGILMEDGGAPLNKYWDLWPFSLEEGLIIFHKLAYGLSTIHQKNIYHGDIKPDNILVKDEYFLFADFGAAVLFNSANDFYVTRNSAGHYLVAYTKAYLAPEIAYFIVHNQEPNQEVKFDKLDIYALVLTIYSLFIKRPINLEEAKIKNVMDPDKYKKFLQIIDTELTNAFTAANCVSRKSKQVIEIMLKCLAFDPRQRPTLTEIVANLNKLL